MGPRQNQRRELAGGDATTNRERELPRERGDGEELH
jgi:hypothetical protein